MLGVNNTVKTELADYSRDLSSGALINTNTTAYKLFLQKRNEKNEINRLQGQIDELSALVKKLLEEKNG